MPWSSCLFFVFSRIKVYYFQWIFIYARFVGARPEGRLSRNESRIHFLGTLKKNLVKVKVMGIFEKWTFLKMSKIVLYIDS